MKVAVIGGGIGGAELIRVAAPCPLEFTLIEPKKQIEMQALYPGVSGRGRQAAGPGRPPQTLLRAGGSPSHPGEGPPPGGKHCGLRELRGGVRLCSHRHRSRPELLRHQRGREHLLHQHPGGDEEGAAICGGQLSGEDHDHGLRPHRGGGGIHPGGEP